MGGDDDIKRGTVKWFDTMKVGMLFFFFLARVVDTPPWQSKIHDSWSGARQLEDCYLL